MFRRLRVDGIAGQDHIQPDQTRSRGVVANNVDEWLETRPPVKHLAMEYGVRVKVVPALQNIGEKLVLGAEMMEQTGPRKADLLGNLLRGSASKPRLGGEFHRHNQGLRSRVAAGRSPRPPGTTGGWTALIHANISGQAEDRPPCGSLGNLT